MQTIDGKMLRRRGLSASLLFIIEERNMSGFGSSGLSFSFLHVSDTRTAEVSVAAAAAAAQGSPIEWSRVEPLHQS